MVIFGAELVGKILAGQKTVTRRRLHGSDTGIGWRGPSRYQAGKVYAVQPGRGKQHVGHIHVWNVYPERLGRMTYVDAQSEGFTSLLDFTSYWETLHGGYDPDEIVTVIRFDLAPRCPDCAVWQP